MKKVTLLFLLALGLIFSACGGGTSDSSSSGEEPETEETSSYTEEAGSNDDPAAQMKEAAKKMQEAVKNMGGENGGAEPINFRELKELLPDKVAGMKSEEKTGETTGMMGMKISMARSEYRDGNKSIEITINDAAGIPAAMMGLASWANLSFDRESDNEVERTFTMDGYKAFEQYNFKEKSGTTAILVADRFVVNVEGRNVERDDIQDAAKELGLKKLEKQAK
jgi:hypothetical protein